MNKGLLEDYCARKYPATIHWVDEQDGNGFYFAYLPDWGYSAVSATAYTQQDALEKLERAKNGMVKYYWDEGLFIPEPTKPPFEQG
jgi:predicted RNase H-like HicB family nuclease